MKYVDFDGRSYRCYLSDNGIERRYLGCYHDKPRQAHKHSSGTFADPLRSVSAPSYPGERAGIAPVAGRSPRLRTNPPSQASPRSRRPPSVTGD